MKKTLLAFAVCTLCMHLTAQDLDTVPYYLDNQMPDAGVYLPAPPDTNSMLFIDDFQQWIWGKSVRATPRGQRASWESEYSVSRMCQIYSEAMGFTISKEATPAIFRLVSRGQKTAAQAVDRAKARYMRIRPFARMNEHVAGAFDDEEHLRGNGSYPSGHTSLGWTTALILAQMAPEQQDTILRRGWEYGESRVIVGAHWGRATSTQPVWRPAAVWHACRQVPNTAPTSPPHVPNTCCGTVPLLPTCPSLTASISCLHPSTPPPTATRAT